MTASMGAIRASASALALAMGGVGCITPSPGGTTTTTTTATVPTTISTTSTTSTTTTTSSTTTTTSTTSTTTTTTTTPPRDPFDIEMRSQGVSSEALTQVQAAVVHWETAIVGGLSPIAVNLPAGSCDPSSSAVSGVVDDIVVDVVVEPIDGVGGTLGYAGPCYVRSSNGLPITGLIKLDSADVDNWLSYDGFEDLVTHEIGHVLGFGTVWSDFDVTTGLGGSDPRFTGMNAVAEYHALGGVGDIPIEADGGAGTRDAHWDEAAFRSELMTGYLSAANPMSAMTIASMKDLGYDVDLGAAEAYTLPATSSLMAAFGAVMVETPHLGSIEPVGRL